MPLSAGTRLGPYEILTPLGAGGMGEVYRARDAKLNRDVAIKVLPATFANDAERLSRFEREAQVLASLNHPNIAAIYGVEERALVMELVEGEALQGPLPVEEALGLARQLAGALEYAHEKGIVHRDLKPANIKVTPEGKLKVLDFGLAKAMAEDQAAPSTSDSPTLTAAATTRVGTILGTAAYMSPEQARGKAVDKRTDIWAFGCVLYETLTGTQVFGGATVSDSVAKILEREPDWQALPESTPANIRHLLKRCLQKDPKNRLRDIGDARLEMDAPAAEPAVALRPRSWERAVLLSLVALLSCVAVWALLRHTTPEPSTVTRVTVALPPGEKLILDRQPAMAFSPDGTRLVYRAGRGVTSQLFLRALDRFETTPIPGTEDADGPFFSPDGQWLGFFAGGKVKKVSLSGGTPFTLADAMLPRGASWGLDDTIVFSPRTPSGLVRIPAAGGVQPEEVTTLSTGEMSHRWPELLPGGQAVLFTVWTGAGIDDAHVDVQSLKTGERRVLIKGGVNGHYLAAGFLVFARGGAMLAVPFDVTRLEVTGPPVPMIEGVAMHPGTGAAQFSLSKSGSILFVPGGERAANTTLCWVDRKGVAQPIPAPARGYVNPKLSPAGRRLAVGIEEGKPGVWIYDLERDTSMLLFRTGGVPAPSWTRDGKRVAFRSNVGGQTGLFWMPADGSGVPERLTTGNAEYPGSWSLDGRVLAASGGDSKSWDLWVLPMDGDRKPRPFLQTPFNEGGGMFSPDGRWLAYTSNESGREEVYIQAYPGSGAKWQVSAEGGVQPVWAQNGKEIFYRNQDKMMAVAVVTQPEFRASKPTLVFEGRYEKGIYPFIPNYDVASDGRFLMIKSSVESAPTQLNFVQNWFEELKGRAAAGAK